MGTFALRPHEQMVAGLPMGRINNLDARVSALEQGGSSSGYQVPISGAVDGTNKTFVWAAAPNALVVDGQSLNRVTNNAYGTTTYWTGTTTTVLAVAPTDNIYAVA